MKKLLSLTLILVMLFGALSACNVRSKDSDTDTNSETNTETDTSAEIDVNSDTSIDISTDTNADSSGGGTACPDDIVNYNPTINNFQIDSEKTNIYADTINEIYAAIRKEEQNIWKQYVKAHETFGDDDPTTRRFVNGWSAIYDLMRHLEMI